MQKLVTLAIATASSLAGGEVYMEAIQASINNAVLTNDIVDILSKRLLSSSSHITINIAEDGKSATSCTANHSLKVMVIEPIVAVEFV